MSLVVEPTTGVDGATVVDARVEAQGLAVKTEIVARLHARYDETFGAPMVEAVAVSVVDELLQEARILTFLPVLAERVTGDRLRHSV